MSEITLRTADPAVDLKMLTELWKEVGWLDGDLAETPGLEVFVKAGDTLVADLAGRPEAMVQRTPGTYRCLDVDLPTCGIAAVVVGRLVRKRGLGMRMTAQQVAAGAAEGAALSVLCIFDEGFYDQLGFGTGPYMHRRTFDPAHLMVEPCRRVPCRLGVDDAASMHRSRLNRRRPHGAWSFDHVGVTEAELAWMTGGFALGFRDDPGGEVSHHIWVPKLDDREFGPYQVGWMAWRTEEQFLELLGLMRNLGDQVHGVRMSDPGGVQLQDYVREPMAHLRRTDTSKFKPNSMALAYWQVRICDLPRCMKALRLPGEPVRCNVRIEDPIEVQLDDDAPWRGIGGEWILEFGPASSAHRGSDPSLPTLQATASGLARLWTGSLPASGIAMTGALKGPGDLIAALDTIIRTPIPTPDWPF